MLIRPHQTIAGIDLSLKEGEAIEVPEKIGRSLCRQGLAVEESVVHIALSVTVKETECTPS